MNRSTRFEFSAISIKRSVAARFRSFSKKIGRTHSDSLVLIMNFFEWHGFYPTERFQGKIMDEILKNRKRTNATIAIIKDIEKTQTRPLAAQMDLLFEGQIQDQEPILIEKKFTESKDFKNHSENEMIPKETLDQMTSKYQKVHKDFGFILDRISITRNRIGKDYLRVDLSEQEFLKIKRAFKNQ